MIYECTDCKHCADFDDENPVVCLHPELQPEQACEYYPVGRRAASWCSGFEYGESRQFVLADYFKAVSYIRIVNKHDWYAGLRRWAEEQHASATVK